MNIKEKAWNLFLLILRLEVLEKPYTQEQTMNAHADMFIVAERNELTHQGAFIALLLWVYEIFRIS